ncbi:MAG: radical SAM protein [Bacteroidia bacterium]|nr:MAG: radical SAM protein [Bacteroidia bacterium]
MNGYHFKPGYVRLHRSGVLKRRGEVLWEILKDCRLCPRECGVNRLEGEKGFCKAGSKLRVASFQAHFGEERPLVGIGGSGTIFLSHCNLGCVFCQNWDLSHQGSGRDCEIEDLASMMLQLQEEGCQNINVVTPTHYSPHVLLALDLAASQGLRLPLVYNTCGWERPDILELLDGVVDIYLADFKYTDPDMARAYSAEAKSYPLVTMSALLEMNRQVGVARSERNGVIYRGLMIRHLVMPGEVSGSMDAMRWIAGSLPADTYVNIMLQYRPAYRAHLYPEIDRPVSRDEYTRVVEEARCFGLTNLDVDI